jgi:hypothetical protein
MNNDLIELTELTDTLNQVLAEENALLDALDLRAAVGLLDRKRNAVAALQGALSSEKAATEFSPMDSEKLRESMQRLTELGQANRTALERGLTLQGRLIQTIAQAVPRARALEAPVYQPNGSQLPPRPPEAYAFQSRM